MMHAGRYQNALLCPAMALVGGRRCGVSGRFMDLLRNCVQILCITAMGAMGMFVASFPARAQDTSKVVSDALERIRAVDVGLTSIKNGIAQPSSGVPDVVLQEQWAQARTLVDLGRIDQAAVVLQELVSAQKFRGSTDYDEALFTLGRCLEHQKRYEAARIRYRELIEKRSRYSSPATARLVEIALTLHDKSSLELWTRQVVDSRELDEATRYAIGKAHYRLRNTVESERWLTSVSGTSSYRAGAQYYLGVIATEQQDYDRARGYFDAAVNTPVPDDLPVFDVTHRDLVRDNALLALGRLFFDLGDDRAAVGYYERISEKSSVAESALFELATIYSEFGQLKKAIQVLDLLEVLALDTRLLIEADILRGDIFAKLGRYEDSVATYQRTVDKLTPIHMELQLFAESESRVEAHLRGLVTCAGNRTADSGPISPEALAFLETLSSADGVDRLFTQLGEQCREFKTALILAENLVATLDLPYRLDLFPTFVANWAELGALDASLFAAYVGLLDAEFDLMDDIGSSSYREEWLSAVRNRKSAYRQYLDNVPQTRDAYLIRRTHAENRLGELRSQAPPHVESLNGDGQPTLKQDSPSSASSPDSSHERALILASVYAAGAAVVEDTDKPLRDALWKACREEAGLLNRVRAERGAAYRETVDSYITTRDMLSERLQLVESLRTALLDKANKKAAELKSTLRQEIETIGETMAQIDQQGSATAAFARKAGADAFRRTAARVQSLMLMGDLGIVDVVWQQKQTRTDKVRKLAESRADKLRELDQSLRSLSTEKFDLVGDRPGAQPTVPATVLPIPPEPAGTEVPDANQN